MRIRCLILAWVVSVPCLAIPQAYVFISFSMPNALLMDTLNESARLHIPATLNGLYNNSMMETVNRVGVLSNQVPNLQLQIDPTAFERFGIQQVPALVVEEGGCFDVMYGHMPLKDGLSRIASHGECGHNTRALQGDIHG